MPPKVKVTREDILNAAVDIIRRNGAAALGARTVASALNCSTQPVFSNFRTMKELHLAVVAQADTLCQTYIQQEVAISKYPAYKASGMAYIRFAKEEKELFKFLFMWDRSGEPISPDSDLNNKMVSLVQQNTNLTGADGQLFHLEMWAFVHGIATMFATGYLDLDWDLVSKMLTDVYKGLKKQYGIGG